MKQKVNSIILSVMLLFGFSWLTGCGSNSVKYEQITSIEDLYAMESNKSYELTCDIDLQGGEWFPLEVKNFNGNGYTIRNCYISTPVQNYDDKGYKLSVSGGFFAKLNRLEDIAFDNIQVNVTFADGTQEGNGGVVAGEMKEIENVTITNSKGFFTLSSSDGEEHDYVNCGVIAGVIKGTGYPSGKTIKNVQVENCELRCSRIYRALRVGGIAGSVVFHETEIADNKVTDSRIFADADYLYCGGVFGDLEYYSGIASGCVSKNNRFDLKAHPIHTKAVASSVGGVVGCSSKNSNIEKSVSSNNEIILIRSSRNETLFTDNGGYRMGGVVGSSAGKISNCLSDSNTISGSSESMSSKQFASVGGLCGYASATISKSVAQNNAISETNTVSASAMLSAGFVAKTSASVTNCAVHNNTVNGKKQDVFTAKVEDRLFDCYVAGQDESIANANSLPVLSSEQWNAIITVLSLDSDWNMENGILYLELNKIKAD